MLIAIKTGHGIVQLGVRGFTGSMNIVLRVAASVKMLLMQVMRLEALLLPLTEACVRRVEEC